MIATGTLGSLHVTPMLTGIRARSRLPYQREPKIDSTVSKETRSGASQGDEMGGKNLLVATTSHGAEQMPSRAVNINLLHLSFHNLDQCNS
jgi:hypothetical protein